MSKIKEKLNLLLYIFMLAVAIVLVLRAFFIGYEMGEFEGKYYPPEEQGPPEEEARQVNLRALLKPTDELLKEGKQLYQLNCASCHGQDGKGNGPKSAGLNPPPRNFQVEKFKYGASVLEIYNTLTNGVQGTSMPAFDLLPEQDRMAMSHYVRTFVPDPPDNPPELVAELPEVDETGEAAPAEGEAEDTAKAQKTIPLDSAKQEYLAQFASIPKAPAGIKKNETFEKHCASCHGSYGEGRLKPEQVVPSSVIYLDAGVLAGKDGGKLESRETFTRFITMGTPGLPGHNFGFLTEEELNELYNYIQQLLEAR